MNKALSCFSDLKCHRKKTKSKNVPQQVFLRRSQISFQIPLNYKSSCHKNGSHMECQLYSNDTWHADGRRSSKSLIRQSVIIFFKSSIIFMTKMSSFFTLGDIICFECIQSRIKGSQLQFSAT